MKALVTRSEIKDTLESILEKENCHLLNDNNAELIWHKPFIRIASAKDPLFAQLKELIGDFHWTPNEILQKRYPESTAQSVIVWCLPASESARISNSKEILYPSIEWAYTRTFGEHINNKLRIGMEQFLLSRGFDSIAPQLHEENVVERRPGAGLSCMWSERHTAFIAGAGTFGISGGLITEKGIAHRLGSVVTAALLKPDIRPYGEDPFAWCLKSAKGSCGVCIERCPIGSIGETHLERDKDLCANHGYGTIKGYGQMNFGWEGDYGCGLCQTGVPCEFQKPLGL
ncbi:MAG: epoxyqueuosine reductase [Spirochaetes bacterium]|nr:epoxyqueuosine reductase [Spirochaetota bacterium]MBL7006635.1 epoxyqueuosine reductase [Spirochaetia bacterium]